MASSKAGAGAGSGRARVSEDAARDLTGELLARVRAQETALRTITWALESGRVHHAYLFVGPEGVGKELAAFGLAQALVCERRAGDGNADADADQGGLFGAASPVAAAAPDGSGRHARACGECSACVRAVPREDTRRPVHPDVVVIERGLYAPQSIGRRTPETQDISIDQIRTLVLARAAFAPHEGRAKVFIVRRAEELSVSAANALLKTLEEPGARTHFILLTSQPEALLPTILSRTQRVRFAPLPDDVVADLLAESGVPPERARQVTRLAGGSVETGLLLADPDESEARDQFVESAIAATTSPTIEPVLALAEAAKKVKDQLPAYLAALAATLAARAADAARLAEREARSMPSEEGGVGGRSPLNVRLAEREARSMPSEEGGVGGRSPLTVRLAEREAREPGAEREAREPGAEPTATKGGGADAEVLAMRGRFALTALEHLASNGAAQLVVEGMLMRMRAI